MSHASVGRDALVRPQTLRNASSPRHFERNRDRDNIYPRDFAVGETPYFFLYALEREFPDE